MERKAVLQVTSMIRSFLSGLSLGFLWAGLGCWVAALASGIGSGVAVVDLISFRWGLISNSSLMFHTVY